MKKTILLSFESIPYFTSEAVKQFVGDETVSDGSIQTTLYRWMKAGHILQLKKGVYMTSRFYELHGADLDFSPAVSAILVPHSYVSLEYILQRRGILTEVTYPVSAITTKQTHVIENKLGTFVFRNIRKDLYNGYLIENYFGIPVSQATLAKALFDYLYLKSWRGRISHSDYNLAEDLRLNLDEFTENEKQEFAEFVERSKSLKMRQILQNLRGTIWRR